MQLLSGHLELENTDQYLGTEIDAALEIAGQIDFRSTIAGAVGSPIGRYRTGSGSSVLAQTVPLALIDRECARQLPEWLSATT